MQSKKIPMRGGRVAILKTPSNGKKTLTEIWYTSHGSGNGTRHIVIVNLEEAQFLQKRYIITQCSHKIIIIKIQLMECV